MKKILLFVVIIGVIIGVLRYTRPTTNGESNVSVATVQVTPVTHASMILGWKNFSIYIDPVGTSTYYTGITKPADIVLVTDVHGDHFSTTTLSYIVGMDTTVIVPQTVYDLLPLSIKNRAKVLKNGETITEREFSITGIPMYNIPESQNAYHTKGRGNGYVIERDGYRVYIAGDTSNTPEMRALQNIDMAFIPMNLPYTMSVEEAAQAVLAFKPKKVFPYHYRGQKGFSDVEEFESLVNASSSDIEVTLVNWYAAQ